jgi:hypothetical protein
VDDGFAYYLTVAYMSRRPRRLARLPSCDPRRARRHPLPRPPPRRDTPADDAPDQQHALRLLDDIRDRYDPAVTWAGFVLELWTRRREFRLAMER